MSLYFRLISVRIRSQLQYRVSLMFETLAMGLQVFVEFMSVALVFSRFGSVGGWSLGEIALLFGLVETGFGAMDMLFSGYDPGFFSIQLQRGTFDQFLLRPLPLTLQMFSAEFVMRRIGRIFNGLLVLSFGLAQTQIIWTIEKALYLPLVLVSIVAFFGGLFVIGATLCFWTTESIEIVNIFTYGGSAMLSYPMHIYDEWLRRIFLYIIPAGLVVYYPALFFLDKPDPLGLPAFAPFLAPVAGFGMLAVAFVFWNIGVRKYTSTGT